MFHPNANTARPRLSRRIDRAIERNAGNFPFFSFSQGTAKRKERKFRDTDSLRVARHLGSLSLRNGIEGEKHAIMQISVIAWSEE